MGLRRKNVESNVEAEVQPEPVISDNYTDAIEELYDQAGISFVQCAAKQIRAVGKHYNNGSQYSVVTCPKFPDNRSDKNYHLFSEAGKSLGNRDVHDPKTQRLLGMEMGCFGCVSFTTGDETFIEGEIVGDGSQGDSAPIALPIAQNP